VITQPEAALDVLLDGFADDTPLVQLQVLTNVMKWCFAQPDAVREQLQFVLGEATRRSVTSDVRDRALLDWPILLLGPTQPVSSSSSRRDLTRPAPNSLIRCFARSVQTWGSPLASYTHSPGRHHHPRGAWASVRTGGHCKPTARLRSAQSGVPGDTHSR
jgi:hypothetical protein